MGMSLIPTPSNGDGETSPMLLYRSLGALADRISLAKRAGLSYGGKRDLRSALGYKDTITPDDYYLEYRRGGIAQTIVDEYPNAVWQDGFSVVEDEDVTITTKFEQDVIDLGDRFDLVDLFTRAHILTALGRYGVIFVGAEGPLNEQMPTLTSIDDIKYLMPLSERLVTVHKVEESDPQSDMFGRPLEYKIKLTSRVERVVHHSRVVHLVIKPLDSEVYGRPVLEVIYDKLQEHLKVVGGGSEATWSRADPGIHANLDPTLEPSPDELDKFTEQLEAYQHGTGRLIKTRGIDLDLLASTVPGFGPNARAIERIISAASKIPQRKLFGAERGELASSQDERNYYNEVGKLRSNFGSRAVRGLVSLLINQGVITKPKSWRVQWPLSQSVSEENKAKLIGLYAKANKDQASAEGGRIILTADQIRDRILDMDPMEETSDVEPRAAVDFVDVQPHEPDWHAVHIAADRNRALVSASVVSFWDSIRDTCTSSDVLKSLQDGDLEKANNIVDVSLSIAEHDTQQGITDAVLKTLTDSAQLVLDKVRQRGTFFSSTSVSLQEHNLRRAQDIFNFNFNKTNPAALNYAATLSSELITEVGPETIAAVKQMIADGHAKGIPPRKLLQQIRTKVGLRTDQVQAAKNLRKRLATAKPGTLVKAGKVRIRIPRTGVTRDLVEKRVAAYEKKLLNDRALLIGRTETIRSANGGIQNLWVQARDAGELSTSQQREWVPTPDGRTRDVHRNMLGVQTSLEAPFPTPDGRTIEPGEEPNCRCSQKLVDPLTEKAA